MLFVVAPENSWYPVNFSTKSSSSTNKARRLQKEEAMWNVAEGLGLQKISFH